MIVHIVPFHRLILAQVYLLIHFFSIEKNQKLLSDMIEIRDISRPRPTETDRSRDRDRDWSRLTETDRN
jgi:hypothetical protein